MRFNLATSHYGLRSPNHPRACIADEASFMGIFGGVGQAISNTALFAAWLARVQRDIVCIIIYSCIYWSTDKQSPLLIITLYGVGYIPIDERYGKIVQYRRVLDPIAKLQLLLSFSSLLREKKSQGTIIGTSTILVGILLMRIHTPSDGRLIEFEN